MHVIFLHGVPGVGKRTIAINTSGETPETTVQNILAMLPNDMKRDIMF